MNPFTFNTTPSIVFESGAARRFGAIAGRRLGLSVLFVTDPGLRKLDLAVNVGDEDIEHAALGDLAAAGGRSGDEYCGGRAGGGTFPGRAPECRWPDLSRGVGTQGFRPLKR